jgi:aryl-alcohol dehydrogenase-like predicted oxidoreductase
VVGLGTNNFGLKIDLEQSRAVVHAALDNGINLFDTSDSYGASEERLGEVLQGKRDDVLIATKFGSDVRRLGQDNGLDWGARGSRRYIRRAVENSLRRLRTDWIDLYQIHRPDPATPIEETLSALDDLVHEGKVRYLGHSNFSGWRTADAEWVARTGHLERFISAQNEYSWLERSIETDLVPALQRYQIGLLPYFPLASGLLTGKYRRGEPPPVGSRIRAWKREAVLTDARRGHRWPGRPARGLLGDRRSHLAGASGRQRQGGAVAAFRRRPGRNRPDHRAERPEVTSCARG